MKRSYSTMASILALGLAVSACSSNPTPPPAQPASVTIVQNGGNSGYNNLRHAVRQALFNNGINANKIDVQVYGSSVVLSGGPVSSDQYSKAASIVAGVPGVGSVQNNLTIQ